MKPTIHCWESDDARSGTCLLPADHAGEHEFTPDENIRLTFNASVVLTGDPSGPNSTSDVIAG